jgi:hypothetical protein
MPALSPFYPHQRTCVRRDGISASGSRGSLSWPTRLKFKRRTRANLNGYQVKWKGWKPCGLAAILWRSTRFATLVLLCSILTGAAGVGSGALKLGFCDARRRLLQNFRDGCGNDSDLYTGIDIHPRVDPLLSDAIRMTGLAASGRAIVSVSGRQDDTTIKSARSAPPTKVK